MKATRIKPGIYLVRDWIIYNDGASWTGQRLCKADSHGIWWQLLEGHHLTKQHAIDAAMAQPETGEL